jgi:hypothetical protein
MPACSKMSSILAFTWRGPLRNIKQTTNFSLQTLFVVQNGKAEFDRTEGSEVGIDERATRAQSQLVLWATAT